MYSGGPGERILSKGDHRSEEPEDGTGLGTLQEHKGGLCACKSEHDYRWEMKKEGRQAPSTRGVVKKKKKLQILM